MSVTPLSESSQQVTLFGEELLEQARSNGVDFVTYVIEFSDGRVGHGLVGSFSDEFQIVGHLNRLQNLMLGEDNDD